MEVCLEEAVVREVGGGGWSKGLWVMRGVGCLDGVTGDVMDRRWCGCESRMDFGEEMGVSIGGLCLFRVVWCNGWRFVSALGFRLLLGVMVRLSCSSTSNTFFHIRSRQGTDPLLTEN